MKKVLLLALSALALAFCQKEKNEKFQTLLPVIETYSNLNIKILKQTEIIGFSAYYAPADNRTATTVITAKLA